MEVEAVATIFMMLRYQLAACRRAPADFLAPSMDYPKPGLCAAPLRAGGSVLGPDRKPGSGCCVEKEQALHRL